jgi:hypothetical protein
MRPTLSRAFTLGRAIGILAAGAASLALPGTSTGRLAARSVQPPEQCAPVGNVVCDHLLETVTVPAGSTGVPTETDFSPDQPYRFVFGGVIHVQGGHLADDHFDVDNLYCFNGILNCTSPIPKGGGGLYASGGSLGAGFSVADNWWRPATATSYPPYSASNSYESPALIGGSAETPPQLSGKITFSSHPFYQPPEQETGAWTIEIFGPSTETVKFAVSQKGHHPGERKAFVRTSTLGVGQVVVPAPQGEELRVTSTSAKGTIVFQKLEVSPHGIRLFDDTVKLAVKRADFYPFGVPGAQYALKLVVSVTKSVDTHECPLAATGTVTITDGGSIPKASDKLHIGIAKCGLNDLFFGKAGGGEGKYGHVTVAITVVKPQPPA